MTDSRPIKRRRHIPEFKTQLIAQCSHPGTSVAQVALNNGVNANLVHKWRREAARASRATDYWYPEFERSLLWNDLAVGMQWPLQTAPQLAAKDAAAKILAEAEVFD